MKTIHVLTGYDGFIGQTRKPWVSIDTPAFIQELRALGFEVKTHDFHEVANCRVEIKDSIVYYSFSHRLNLQHYIRDLLMSLKKQGNILIPNFEMFCCHANKGWQEYLRRELGFGDLNSLYFSSKRELDNYDLKFPLVFKTLDGSNSRGVALVHSKEDILKELGKLEPKPGLYQRWDFFRRKYLRKNKKFPGYPNYDLKRDARLYQDYITPEIPFMLQDFVPNLDCDYRVVALGEHYYISKRLNRKGDFRASGSKHFDFELKDPQRLLQYTAEIRAKLDVPSLSVDLGVDRDSGIHLFEFQAQHFGIFTILNAPGYWFYEDSTWKFNPGHASFEAELARALHYFVNT